MRGLLPAFPLIFFRGGFEICYRCYYLLPSHQRTLFSSYCLRSYSEEMIKPMIIDETDNNIRRVFVNTGESVKRRKIVFYMMNENPMGHISTVRVYWPGGKKVCVPSFHNASALISLNGRTRGGRVGRTRLYKGMKGLTAHCYRPDIKGQPMMALSPCVPSGFRRSQSAQAGRCLP